MSKPEATVFADNESGHPGVRGVFHAAKDSRGDVLILTHGAGGNCNTPVLVTLAEAFAESGLHVLRCDLPFRQLRPKGPPSPAGATRDQQGLRRAVTLMRQRYAGRVYLGGQSYGGRQASMLAAAEPELVSGLLLLSYPLHPPGRSAQMRTAHFPGLNTPILFVHGTSDPFATSEELASAIRLIPARTSAVELDGAGHSLMTKHNQSALRTAVLREFATLFGIVAPK